LPNSGRSWNQEKARTVLRSLELRGRAAALATVLTALLVGASLLPAASAAANGDGSADVLGVTVSAPEMSQISARGLTRNGNGIVDTGSDVATEFAYSLTTSAKTTVHTVQLSLRGTGGVVEAGQQSNLTVNGSRSLRASATLSDGDWVAAVHLTLDGRTWGAGPGLALTVADGIARTTGLVPAEGSPTASPSPTTSPSPSPTASPSPSPTASPSPSPSPSPTPTATATPTTSPSPSPSPSPTSSTAGTSVHALGYFYRPPVGTDLGVVASTHQRYILTKKDEPTRDTLKSRGAKGPFLQYLRFEAIMDDTGLGYQWHNQVAWKSGDWQNISKNHPDWFLLDKDGKRMKAGLRGDAEERFYLMDPMHPGWRAFFVQRMAEMQTVYGWDGVFLDNVELSLAKRQRTGQLPAKYPDDASYTAAVKSFLSHLRTEYFRPTGRPIEANLIEQRHGNDPVWHEMLQLLDGGMREGWVAGWDFSKLRSASSWLSEIQQLEQSQAAGRHVWVVEMGRKDDLLRQQYSYASFLLAANGRASYRYTDSSRYDEVWTYPNYALDLGSPVGPRYKVGNAWVRDFTKGRVTVDPVAGTSSIAPKT
jgi:hypothetical protein